MIFGALLSLASSFSFSVNSILVRRGIAGAGATASQGAFITVLLGVPFGFAAVVITGQVLRFGEVSPAGYVLLLAAGIIHFRGREVLQLPVSRSDRGGALRAHHGGHDAVQHPDGGDPAGRGGDADDAVRHRAGAARPGGDPRTEAAGAGPSP